MAQKAGFVRSGGCRDGTAIVRRKAQSRHVISMIPLFGAGNNPLPYSKVFASKRNNAFSKQTPAAKGNGREWRRRQDLNPRYGFPYYSLSRGAP